MKSIDIKPVVMTVPDYYTSFVCKCGECRHPCCDGWGISVSRSEYFRLVGLECSKRLRHRLDDAFEPCDTPDIEKFASIHPNYLGDCPMLDGDGKCLLQKECGEDALPLICRLYPRSVKKYGDSRWACMSNSCEGVIELLMSSEKPLSLVEREISVPFDGIAVADETGEKDALRLSALEIMSGGGSVFKRLRAIGERICGVTAMPPVSRAEAVSMMRDFISAVEKHSASIRVCGERALAHIDGMSDGEAYDYFLRAEKHLLSVIPSLDAYSARIICNHMLYESFPFPEGCRSLDVAFAGLCSSMAMLKFICVLDMAECDDVTEFVDTLAGVCRFIEHTDYYGLSAGKKHPSGGEVFSRFAPILEV